MRAHITATLTLYSSPLKPSPLTLQLSAYSSAGSECILTATLTLYSSPLKPSPLSGKVGELGCQESLHVPTIHGRCVQRV